jgi:hypothetical protein
VDRVEGSGWRESTEENARKRKWNESLTEEIWRDKKLRRGELSHFWNRRDDDRAFWEDSKFEGLTNISESSEFFSAVAENIG